MARAFTAWTVLPHRPIQKLSENLWTVAGTMPDGKTQRVMSVARMADGRLVIHNAIALEEPLMAELEAFGTPAVLVVPNGYHRMDARVFKDRYPALRVICPAGARKRVSQVVAPDGTYDDAPRDEAVSFEHMRAMKNSEGVLTVRSADGATLVFNDAITNLPKLGFPIGMVLAPTGRPSVPRVLRLLAVTDKRAAADHLRALADTPGLRRVVVSHGAMLDAAPADTLRAVAAELAG